MGIPLIVCMLGFFFFRESPLFYLSKRSFNRFTKLIKYVAKVNKKKLDKSFKNFLRYILSRSYCENKFDKSLSNKNKNDEE